MQLNDAIRYVDDRDRFVASDQGVWIEFRKGVEEYLKHRSREENPALQAAFDAVADCPEQKANAPELWEELRHQAIVAAG